MNLESNHLSSIKEFAFFCAQLKLRFEPHVPSSALTVSPNNDPVSLRLHKELVAKVWREWKCCLFWPKERERLFTLWTSQGIETLFWQLLTNCQFENYLLLQSSNAHFIAMPHGLLTKIKEMWASSLHSKDSHSFVCDPFWDSDLSTFYQAEEPLFNVLQLRVSYMSVHKIWHSGLKRLR